MDEQNKLCDKICSHEKLEEGKGSVFCVTCGLEKDDHVPFQKHFSRTTTNRRSTKKKTDEEGEVRTERLKECLTEFQLNDEPMESTEWCLDRLILDDEVDDSDDEDVVEISDGR